MIYRTLSALRGQEADDLWAKKQLILISFVLLLPVGVFLLAIGLPRVVVYPIVVFGFAVVTIAWMAARYFDDFEPMELEEWIRWLEREKANTTAARSGFRRSVALVRYAGVGIAFIGWRVFAQD